MYFDGKSYYSCDLVSGQSLNLTSEIDVTLSQFRFEDNLLPGNRFAPFGIAGWLPNDDAMLVYDKYDIWQIDPSGKNVPVNVTNGFGRKQHIKFRLVNEDDAVVYSPNESLLLVALDSATKNNGFYRLLTGKVRNPEMIEMCPKFISKQIKAKSSNKWIVMRESSNEAPNLFLTTDFKKL